MSPRSFFSLSGCLLCCAAAWGQQYTISTYAGNYGAGAGYAGDSGAATAAQLNNPTDLVVDSSGNVYIADTNNNIIRKVSAGTITTVAGYSASCNNQPLSCTPAGGYSGDGGTATSAELKTPAGLAVDSNGNIYIADTGNFVIREVTGGKINTIAGDGNSAYQGENSTPALSAEFVRPTGIAVDSAGNVYISDAGTSTDANGNTIIVNLIRKLTGTNISSYVGAGGTITSGKLNNPTGIWVDPTGTSLYIADTSNKRVVRYVPSLGTAGFVVVAGIGVGGFSGDGGNAAFADLNNPQGVAVDAAGNVYIADTTNNRIRKVSNGIITTIAGNGSPGYSGDGGAATNAKLQFPRGVAVDAAGNVYIADSGNNVVRVLTPQVPTVSNNGVVNGASFQPQISPGAWASVFGTNFPATQSASTVPLPTSLAATSVLVNGKAASLLFVSPNQINFQVPWETTPGTATTISVTVNGGASNTVTIPASNVLTAGPAFFFVNGGAPAVENSDGSLNNSSNPVAAGGIITAYLNGSGPVSPAVADGAAASTSGYTNMTSNVTANIGSSPATVQFAGLAPGFISLVQMNIIVPAGLTTGSYPLTITVNNESTATPASISVR